MSTIRRRGAPTPSELRDATTVEVPAQAKVNLRLRILARERDGYHQLETLFLRLDLADVVRVRRTGGRTRTLDVSSANSEQIGPVEQNLAWRAAEAYAAATGFGAGLAIEVDKRIPIGGGLGGGSADAGAVLRAMNAMAPTALSDSALLRLGSTLGADVPFMTTDRPYALGWGRGDRLLALVPPPAREVLLLVPAFSVSTRDAYGWLADSRGQATHSADVDAPLAVDILSSWVEIATLATNDFETVVGMRHPEIATLVHRLRGAGCAPALMSGSGSVVFGVLPPTAGPRVAGEFHLSLGPSVAVTRTRTSTRVEPVSPIE